VLSVDGRLLVSFAMPEEGPLVPEY
jgi:hypothetical protein